MWAAPRRSRVTRPFCTALPSYAPPPCPARQKSSAHVVCCERRERQGEARQGSHSHGGAAFDQTIIYLKKMAGYTRVHALPPEIQSIAASASAVRVHQRGEPARTRDSSTHTHARGTTHMLRQPVPRLLLTPSACAVHCDGVGYHGEA